MEPRKEAIEIDSTIAARLRERAAAEGITLDELVRPLAEDKHGTQVVQDSGMTPEQRAKAFREWAESHDPNTPVILDDSRDSIYD
jgi:hypothetical protein